MGTAKLYQKTITLPRAVRFPVEFTPPDGFLPERLETWPHVEGRLEWVAGRLLYMPPCGERQQETVADVVTTLGIWVRSHPEFSLGTNEAGMHLGTEVRAAHAAIWKLRGAAPSHSGLRREPPVLAVEVSGQDEGAAELRHKARWYLDAGVQVVWNVLPGEREVRVLTARGETRHGPGQHLPAVPGLPGLSPAVDDLFRQITRRAPTG